MNLSVLEVRIIAAKISIMPLAISHDKPYISAITIMKIREKKTGHIEKIENTDLGRTRFCIVFKGAGLYD